jgi:hypothetical protein
MSEESRQLRFNETEKEAIADDVKALGGPKPAAALLHPGKSPERGADLMRAWSNPSRQEEPSLDEIIQLVELARARAGYSEIIRYIEQRLNCRIEFLTIEDERARLQKQFVDAVGIVQSLAKRLEINEGRK